jgi:hypothetical protein
MVINVILTRTKAISEDPEQALKKIYKCGPGSEAKDAASFQKCLN